MAGSSAQLPSGLFLVFEGGEGSGKSTQARLLAAAVERQGRKALLTREPGGSERAESIRHIILGEESADLDPRTEALLFAAARADHVAHTIRPALQAGDVVISDRFVDSSAAYQGVARGLGAHTIRDLSSWATDQLLPDLTIVLDIDPAIGLQRAEDANRLEAEPIDFHNSVRKAFLDFAAAQPDRYFVISADDSAAQIHSRIWQELTSRGVLA